MQSDVAQRAVLSLLDTTSFLLFPNCSSSGVGSSVKNGNCYIPPHFQDIVDSFTNRLVSLMDAIFFLNEEEGVPSISVFNGCLDVITKNINYSHERGRSPQTSRQRGNAILEYYLFEINSNKARDFYLNSLKKSIVQETQLGGTERFISLEGVRQYVKRHLLFMSRIEDLAIQMKHEQLQFILDCLTFFRRYEKDFYLSYNNNRGMNDFNSNEVSIHNCIIQERMRCTIHNLVVYATTVCGAEIVPDALFTQEEVRAKLLSSVQACEAGFDYESLANIPTSTLYEQSVAVVASIIEGHNASTVSNILGHDSEPSQLYEGFSSSNSSTMLTNNIPELSDYGKMISIFDGFQLNPQKMTTLVDSGYYVCSEDIIGLIDDVINYHLALPITIISSHSRNLSPSVYFDKMISSTPDIAAKIAIPVDEVYWETISGSADLLTVLASTSINAASSTATVRVRVFNSAGFKIPYFRIRLLLAPAHPRRASSEPCTLTASFINSEKYDVEGAEYFLPNAYIERRFKLSINRIGAVQIVVRLVFPDLVREEEDLCELGIVAGQPSKGLREKRAVYPLGLHIAQGFQSAQSKKWAAHVDCSPVLLPISSQLLPYGAGSFSSLQYFLRRMDSKKLDTEVVCGGMPFVVFCQLWHRLQATNNEFTVPVSGIVTKSIGIDSKCGTSIDTDALTAQHTCRLVREHVAREVSRSGGVGLYILGNDCQAEISEFLGWALHSLWGHEIAAKLCISTSICRGYNGDSQSADSKDNDSQCVWFEGSLEVRCSESKLLSHLLSDLQSFLYSLSAGSFTLKMQ